MHLLPADSDAAAPSVQPPTVGRRRGDQARSGPRRTSWTSDDREGDVPPPQRWLLPLAICVGTFTLLMGVTSGASAHHRTGHPLSSSCRLRQDVDTYAPTLPPMLRLLGTPPADRSCDATVPARIPAPTPGPVPTAEHVHRRASDTSLSPSESGDMS